MEGRGRASYGRDKSSSTALMRHWPVRRVRGGRRRRHERTVDWPDGSVLPPHQRRRNGHLPGEEWSIVNGHLPEEECRETAANESTGSKHIWELADSPLVLHVRYVQNVGRISHVIEVCNHALNKRL